MPVVRDHMRRLQLYERKKLRGIPRRLRSLSKWADQFTLPWMFSSEVTIFYDPEYYLRFFGERHGLEPRKLSSEYGLVISDGFVERGFIVKDEEEGIDEEWWCVGQPI